MDTDEDMIYDLGWHSAPDGFKLKKHESFIWCPFDSTHIVVNSNIQAHLYKCRRVHVKTIEKTGGVTRFSRCKYNGDHAIVDAEKVFHEETCPYRRSREVRRATSLRPVAVAVIASSPEEWENDNDNDETKPGPGRPSRSPSPTWVKRYSRSPAMIETCRSRSPSAGAYSPRRPALRSFSPLPNSPQAQRIQDLGYVSTELNSISISPDQEKSPKEFRSSYSDDFLKLPVFHRTGEVYTEELDPEEPGQETEANELARDLHKHILEKANFIKTRAVETLDPIEKEALEDWDLQAKLFPPDPYDPMKNAEYKMKRYVTPPPGLSKSERKAWRQEWSNKIPRVYDPTDPDFIGGNDQAAQAKANAK